MLVIVSIQYWVCIVTSLLSFCLTEQMSEIRFSEAELREVRQVLGKPVCVVVGGQDAYGKVVVVTRLLTEQVLPIVPLRLLPAQPWRPIRLKHSQTRSVSLTLPEGNAMSAPPGGPSGYELVHSLQAHSRPWDTVPRADVELDQRDLQVSTQYFNFCGP